MPGHTAADAAPVAASDSGHKRRWWILAHPSGSPGAVAHPHERRRDGARRLTARRRSGPAPFAAVYLLYNASRWRKRRTSAKPNSRDPSHREKAGVPMSAPTSEAHDMAHTVNSPRGDEATATGAHGMTQRRSQLWRPCPP
ncbi:MAG: hypothetical protein QOG59_970 [Solirubrobacteraceae bacterium]|nr:hypothetical protein [Solirubrobacteraceae bacterium]